MIGPTRAHTRTVLRVLLHRIALQIQITQIRQQLQMLQAEADTANTERRVHAFGILGSQRPGHLVGTQV